MLSGMCSNHFPQSFPTWFSHTRQYRIWVPTINSFAANIGSDIYRQVDINTNDEVENNKKNVAMFVNEDHKKNNRIVHWTKGQHICFHSQKHNLDTCNQETSENVKNKQHYTIETVPKSSRLNLTVNSDKHVNI